MKVARGGFEGPVTVEFPDAPDGVTIPPVVIPADKTEGTAFISASRDAKPGVARLAVKATATADGEKVAAGTALSLRVGTPPPATGPAVVDVVFVLDVTGSMAQFIEGVKDGIGDFADELKKAKIDARVALVAFRDGPNKEPSEVLKFANGPFTTDIPAFKKAVAKLKADGGGDEEESSLDALVEAAGLKFRPQTARVLILITDVPPKLPDLKTKSVAACVAALTEKKIDQVHLVTRKVDLKKFYQPFADNLSGVPFDLERVTKGGEKFAKILPELGKAIEATIESSAGRRGEGGRRAGGEAAAGRGGAGGLDAGAAAARDAAAGRGPPRGDAGPAGPAPEDRPARGEGRAVERAVRRVVAGPAGAGRGRVDRRLSGLVCLALLAGQHHYLRGSLPSAGAALAGLGGGLAVGVVGGAAGQGLFLLADTDSKALDAVFRVTGWALLGALAGAGLSLFIPNLKLAYGLGGGAVGGAAGAVGFLAVTGALGALDTAPKTADLLGRLAGGLVLGFCIGLMVAVVEAAFRRAWLEVRYGDREVVTVNLGAEPVKVGGDSKLCTVWARAPPRSRCGSGSATVW